MHGRPLILSLRSLFTSYLATRPWRLGPTRTPSPPINTRLISPSTKTRPYTSRVIYGEGRNPWQPHETETFLKGHEEGLTYVEIAKLLPGRSRHAVAEYAREHLRRQKLPYRKKPWTTHEIETLVKGRDEGLSNSEIAKLLPGRTRSAVRTRRQKLTYEAKPRKTQDIEGRDITEELSHGEMTDLLPGQTQAAVASTTDRYKPYKRENQWNMHEIETLRKGITEGLNLEEVVNLLPGRTVLAAKKIARKHQFPSTAPQWNMHEIETLRKGITEGLSNGEIAELLPGRTKIAVAMSAHRQPSNHMARWKTEEIETAMRGRTEGLRNMEIAKLLPGRTQTAVQRLTYRLSRDSKPLRQKTIEIWNHRIRDH